MASIITELIPDQPFVIIQNKIAEILFEELTAQHALQSLDSQFEVFIERIPPYSISEDVMISVVCKEQRDSEYTQRGSQSEIFYFIDIFTGGIEDGDETMSENVRRKLFKYVGMIKYILNSGKYPTLGFPPGLIGNRHVQKFTYDTDYSNWGNHSNYDAKGVRFCRILFYVKALESTESWSGIPLDGNDTIIHTNTDKGTKLIFNN